MSRKGKRRSGKREGVAAGGGARRSKGNGGVPASSPREGVAIDALAREAISSRAKVLVDLLEGFADKDGADSIHDLRVASRRFREAVAFFRKLLPKKGAKKASESARSVTRALGSARNADVGAGVLLGLGEGAWERAAGALATRLRRRGREIRRKLTGVLAEVDVRALRERARRLEAALDDDRRGRKSLLSPAEFAHPLLEKRVRRLFRRQEDWGDAAETKTLHETRIAAKKLRYAIEVLEPAFGEGYGERRDLLRTIQDALGRYQDVSVLLDEAAAWERRGSPATRPAGRGSWRALEARLLEERRASHKSFNDLVAGWSADSFMAHLLVGLEEAGGVAPAAEPHSKSGGARAAEAGPPT